MTAKETRKVNNDISWLYIVYQWILMGTHSSRNVIIISVKKSIKSILYRREYDSGTGHNIFDDGWRVCRRVSYRQLDQFLVQSDPNWRVRWSLLHL